MLFRLLISLPFFLICHFNSASCQIGDSLLCPNPDIRNTFDSLHNKYHYYRVEHLIIDKGQYPNASKSKVFSIMCGQIHFAAPFPKKVNGAVQACEPINVKIGFTRKNPILSSIDSTGLRLINYSLPGHLLHPGKVLRSVVEKENKIYVITESWGEGRFPKMNVKKSEKTWRTIDKQLALYTQEKFGSVGD
ncbi:MAG: hypothetical protein MRZ79_20850 [Bacteroidia bacterium]|nr:hypothetical protein [Bacteroidia bacterium]